MRLLTGVFLAGSMWAQISDLPLKHSFENGTNGEAPPRWGGSGDAVVDAQVAHGGQRSVRLVRNSAESFSTVTNSIPIDFAGKSIEIRGWLKLEAVEGWTGLWIRADGDDGVMAFDNMQSREIKGTADWKQYSTTIEWKPAARVLYYGVLLTGKGKVWADDLEILVDGKPVWEAPKAERPKTVLDTDTEFAAGSKIALPELTPVQVANLVLLGKVWGFAKYHHPRVTAGELHWDFELFRVLPKVLAAADRKAAQAVLAEWLKSYGEPKPCEPCAGELKRDELHLAPPIEWTTSEAELGAPLRDVLRLIYDRRTVQRSQFYLKRAMGTGNAQFENEPGYANAKLPDAGFQLLAVYRFWNIVQYWFPYRDLIEEDWDGVLAEFIPRVMRAPSKPEYQRELIALIGRVHDTHANLWSGITAQPPAGACTLTALFRFVEGKAVVMKAESGPLQVGDVVESIDGRAVAELVKEWSPYYPASNEPARLRDIGRSLGRGACGETKLRVTRGTTSMEMAVERVTVKGMERLAHDRPGEAFQKLSPEVAYLKMGSVTDDQLPKYLDLLSGSKVLIIDSRNYPKAFTPFTLGGALVDEPTAFARFTSPSDPVNPGAFYFGSPMMLRPRSDAKFTGKVIVLVDESSQSSSEYQSMAWSAGPRAKLIGSMTAAADGNVSRIALPGGQNTMISGLGVFYPDKRPTQRVGLKVAIEVKPTIQGVREGRDEVLERALREALGPEVPAEEIVRMARPPKN